MYDDYAQEFFFSREQWRDNVLPGTLKEAWDNPDELYTIIATALRGGFRSAVIDASEHLYQIDSDRIRAACIWGIVLREEDRLEAAESVFRDCIAKNGEDGAILTNLAKVYAKRHNDAKVEEILWHALEIDPNQDNGLEWYEALHRERDGLEGSLTALERIAGLPGSWRAQLWLARKSLASKQFDRAMAYYSEALGLVERPVPSDFLMQMSGDLGLNGHFSELLKLTEPLFNAELHGVSVGNNLIHAHLDLGQIDAARLLVDQLYACKRPDWQQALNFWDTEIAKAHIASAPAKTDDSLSVRILSVENPVWLPASSPACELLPPKPADEFAVCFLGSTAKVANPAQVIQHQLADNSGRMSRALPLFLAEQTYFGSHARVCTLIPCVTGSGTGFAVWERPWSDKDAAGHAKQATPQCDYVVVTHLQAHTEPWTVELRLIRTTDVVCVATLQATFSCTAPQDALPQLASNLLAALSEHAGLQLTPYPQLYEVPPAQLFPNYLLRLEQLLAVRHASMEGVQPGFLNCEREILDGNIQLCVACPDNITTRLLLAQTFSSMNEARPDILPEFQDKVALLQKQKPLRDPAEPIVERMLEQVWTE